MIEIQSVTKLYGSQKALDNVSFTVNTGEIVGFLGPNGAGKSTMMKIIAGVIPASSGTVKINGTESGDDNIGLRTIIGYLPENNPLYPEMYVREYLGFVASFYRQRDKNINSVDEIISRTGLTPEQGKKIGALSKGYRQRVGLAQALIHNPEILILDEATTGLDPNQIVEIRNLIRQAGTNKTVILSTHIMQEVEAICDRVIIIDSGIIVADELKENIYSRFSKPGQVVLVEFDREIDTEKIKALTFISRVEKINNSWRLESATGEDIRTKIFSFAVENSLTVLSMQKQESNLEEVFRQITKS